MRLEARVNDRAMAVGVRRTATGYVVSLDQREMEIELVETGDGFCSLLLDGQSHEVGLEPAPEGYRVHLRDATVDVRLSSAGHQGEARPALPAGPARLTAPMPGRVVRVLAEEGSQVEPGQGLVVIEAMKMENELKSPRGGCVDEVAVREGQAVEAGALLLVVN